MQAALRERYGPPDLIEVRDVAMPVPAPDQVLVKVAAASINRADLDLQYGVPSFARLFTGLRGPRDRAVGIDVAGMVDTVGASVTRFRPGDRVFGDLYPYKQGAFAEFACAPEKAFEPIPDALSFEQAASIPHSAILAIQGLRLRNGRTVSAGARVLIDGASGSVGPFAVQIAKALGAEVTAVCSGGKVDFVRGLGADHVIDYREVDYTATGERYDWILAVASHHSLLRARQALRRGGVYVTLGGSTSSLFEAMLLGPLISIAGGRRMGLMLWWKPFDPADVGRLTELVESGRVAPIIDRRYPLAQVVEALRYVDDGHATGKVLITPI